jgi:hypothetical protein
MLSLAILMIAAGMEAQPSVPVWSDSVPPAGSVRGYACNLAVVRGIGSSRLPVRVGPGRRFKRRDALREGERVYTCNERGKWLGVVFSRPNATCGNQQPIGLDITLTRSCRSGWVHRRWIEIITG